MRSFTVKNALLPDILVFLKPLQQTRREEQKFPADPTHSVQCNTEMFNTSAIQQKRSAFVLFHKAAPATRGC